MNPKIAVVLVHGFTGGTETWINSSGKSFLSILNDDPELKQHFEFYSFEYFSKVLGLLDSAVSQKILRKIPFVKYIPRMTGRTKKNRPISKLSEELGTFLSLSLNDAEQVILIGHSMGGLVVKDHILNHEAGYGPSPIGYVSLAVPHKGALPAALLGFANVNASELTPLSEYSVSLNDSWSELKTKLPKSLYIIAQYDEFVPTTSAIPFPVSQKEKATVPHDHTSICKPATETDLTYLAVKKFLKQVAYEKSMHSIAETTATQTSPGYDKEIFVLKMMVCDIGKKGIRDAKDCFFNAEIISKNANKFDLTELRSLQAKVFSLYQQKYNECTSKGLTANDIFAKVHTAITEQDSGVLSSSVAYLSFLHKKGLLHQLANNMKDDVIWDEDTDFDWIAQELK